MNDYTAIDERVLRHARLFLKRGENVRTVAKKTGWSKSTVDLDIRIRLKELNFFLHNKVMEKIEKNRNERHIRGGEQTRKKWKKKRERDTKKNG